MINLKLLGAFIGQQCIEHHKHGKYTLDGFYSKGVMATRNLTGKPKDEEYEMFGFDEITFIESVMKNSKFIIELKHLEIEQAVCGFTGFTPEQIQTEKRQDRQLVEARQLCHYIARKNGFGSLALIGWRFGRKEHATVLHSTKTISNLLETDRLFREQYKPILTLFDHGNSNLAKDRNGM